MSINLDTLVSTFAPQVYFHPEEEYLPSSVDWYCSQVSYYERESNSITPAPTILPPGWSWESIPNGQWDYLSPATNSPVLNGNLSNAVAYVHVLDVTGVANQVDLQYWFFYPNNGSEILRIEGVFGIVGESPLSLSEHIGDWEHITVRVDISASAPKLVAVYFAQHSGGAWMLQAPSDDPDAGYSLTNGTHPVVYSANGTHASYPSAGGPFLVGGRDINLCEFQVVDYTGKGQSVNFWETNRYLIVKNDSSQFSSTTISPPAWLEFNGIWGPPTTNSLSPLELAQAVLQILKTTFAASAPLLIVITWLLTPGAVLFLAALGTFLFEMIFGYDENGPQTPSNQGAWSKTPAFLNWSRDEPATSSGIGQPALISTGSSTTCYYNSLPGAPKISTWSDGKWTEVGNIGKTSFGGTVAAVSTGDAAVVIFSDGNGHLTAYSGSYKTWNQIAAPPVTPVSGFTLIEFSGLYYFFYRCATGGALSYVTTGDWQTWTGEQQVPNTSMAASKGGVWAISPAAAVLNNTLFVAYLQTQIPGTSAPDLVVAPLSVVNDVPTWGEQSVIATEASTCSPGLTSSGTQLVCAFTDDKKVIRYSVSTDGADWTASTAFPNALSQFGPALTAVGSTLMSVHAGKQHFKNYYSTVNLG
jgi:hypothetical protein